MPSKNLKPEIKFATLNGKMTFNLHPVPMTRMPSQNGADWLKFTIKHVAEAELAPAP